MVATKVLRVKCEDVLVFKKDEISGGKCTNVGALATLLDRQYLKGFTTVEKFLYAQHT